MKTDTAVSAFLYLCFASSSLPVMDPVVLAIRMGAIKDAVEDGKAVVLRCTAAQSREEMDMLHEELQEIFDSRLHRTHRAAQSVADKQGTTAR